MIVILFIISKIKITLNFMNVYVSSGVKQFESLGFELSGEYLVKLVIGSRRSAQVF